MKESSDYDFDEICPHCDFVNQVKWDGKSKVTVCEGCHRTIALCSICEHCGEGCGTCTVTRK